MLAVHAHVARDAGIVHQQRQPSIFLQNLFGCLLDTVKVAKFDAYPTQHVDTSRLQFADGLLGTLSVACANDYLPTTLSKVLGDSKSDALVGTSHKNNLFFHIFLKNFYFCVQR